MAYQHENPDKPLTALSASFQEAHEASIQSLQALRHYQRSRNKLEEILALTLRGNISADETLDIPPGYTLFELLSDRRHRLQSGDSSITRLIDILETDNAILHWPPSVISKTKMHHFEGSEYSDAGASDTMASSLRELFDTIGDLKLMQEFVDYELPQEHADERRERQRLKDQDQEFSVTSVEFEDRLESRRLEAQENIARMGQRVESLQNHCRQKNYDTDPKSYIARSMSQVSSHRSPSGNVETWLHKLQSTDSLPWVDEPY